jgi:sRNA-binding protein
MSTDSRYKAIGDLFARLRAEYPRCFYPLNARPLPLKIGIYKELREYLGDEISDDLLHDALSVYCTRRVYLEALWANGAARVGLDGKRVGPVDRTALKSLPPMPQDKRPAPPTPTAAKPKSKPKSKKVEKCAYVKS